VIVGVVLVFSFALGLSASTIRRACADDQDGTCSLYVYSITGNTGSFLSGWVEAGDFYGKNAVHAGPNDQSTLTGAALSTGTVFCNSLVAYQSKQFRIDHPLDPANRVLSHFSIESDELKNLYDGVVTLDASGSAVVVMPTWFEALNGDFRYQLTPIGASGNGLYVSEELTAGHFKIAGGRPGHKVSWQVTGVRHDASARNSRVPVEENKADDERGKYLDPAAFGKPESDSLMRARMAKEVGSKRQH
jgi:hypothetical protein